MWFSCCNQVMFRVSEIRSNCEKITPVFCFCVVHACKQSMIDIFWLAFCIHVCISFLHKNSPMQLLHNISNGVCLQTWRHDRLLWEAVFPPKPQQLHKQLRELLWWVLSDSCTINEHSPVKVNPWAVTWRQRGNLNTFECRQTNQVPVQIVQVSNRFTVQMTQNVTLAQNSGTPWCNPHAT